LEPDRGGARRLVGLAVRAVGGLVHGDGGRRHRHRRQLDDRPQVRHLPPGVLAEQGAVLLVLQRDQFRLGELLAVADVGRGPGTVQGRSRVVHNLLLVLHRVGAAVRGAVGLVGPHVRALRLRLRYPRGKVFRYRGVGLTGVCSRSKRYLADSLLGGI
jgi:hypothetical protein